MLRRHRPRLVLLLAAALLAGSAGTASAVTPGIYQVWGTDADVAKRPYVKGGQIVLEWKTVEPARGRFDWSSLNAELGAYARMGKPATVQINSTKGKPAWVWNIVARCGSTRGQDIPQYWDPLYMTLQKELIGGLANALKASPHRSSVALVRANPNAIGTELTEVPGRPVCRPAANGHKVSAQWSKTLQWAYYRDVMGLYRSAMLPEIHPALRTDAFTTGKAPLSWLGPSGAWIFGTASDIDPNPTRDTFDVFARQWAGSGRTQAYWEPISDAGKRNLASWNYWRILLELHKGVSFIAVYGNEIRRGDDPEFRAAFDLANRHAGWQSAPERAPGAFIALKQGMGRTAGNLSRFIDQYDPQGTSEALDSRNGAAMIGPATQRFGRFARRITGGTAKDTMSFSLDPAFARGVRGREVVLSVIYLDQGSGSFRVGWGQGASAQATVQKHGTGRWQQFSVRIARAAFSASLPHNADIAITALGHTAAVFHMVAVDVPSRR
jgi:hypothetical protein